MGCLGRRERSPCPPACDAGAVSTCASRRSAYTKRSLHVTSSGRQGGKRKGQEREERPQREPGEKGDRAPSTRPWVSLYIPTGEEGAAPASPGHRNGQAVPNGGSSPPGPSHRGGQAVPYSSKRSLPGPGHKGGQAVPYSRTSLPSPSHRASIGQVWTRHLAPAAPASRPSSPSQFHDCPCHADTALQFVPSLVPGWGKSRAASTGFRALSPSD